MCFHGEVMWQEPALCERELTKKALGYEKLVFKEQILEASKFIVESSSSGPGNEASHWADCRSRTEGVWPWYC